MTVSYTHLIRNFLDAQNFMEVETPILIGSTPAVSYTHLICLYTGKNLAASLGVRQALVVINCSSSA